MSYGVIASRSGHLMVGEALLPGSRGVPPDALARFRSVWGGMWVPGRLTLTRLHVTFVPHAIGKGVRMLEVNVGDVSGVELSSGMVSRTITVATPRRAMYFKCLAAQNLAHEISVVAAAGEERVRPGRRR